MQAKLMLKVRKENVYLLLSAIVPITIRSIPELAFPYPIGFDTPLYFAMGKMWIDQPLPFPLFVSFIGLLYHLGVDLALAMKFIPTLVYGLLGTASFMFARRYLMWDLFDSLLASISLSLSIAMLRMSWDMHKLTLGIALMLLSLSFWRATNVKGKASFLILSVLTIISHELITVTYLLTLTVLIFRRSENRLISSTVLLLGLLCFLGAWYGSQLEKVFGWIPAISSSAPFSSVAHELSTNGLLIMKLYLLTIPISVVGFFRDEVVATWLAFNLLGSTSTIISPSFLLGGVLPWRYILLLTVPLSIYAARGALTISRKVGAEKAFLWALTLVSLVNLPSYSFLTTGSLGTYVYEGIMPERMAQSSIPIHDIEPTISLSKRISEGTLIVHGDFVGWARYYSGARVIGFGGTYGAAPTLEQTLALIEDKTKVYLIYWNDIDAERLGFRILAIGGNLKLYKYAPLGENDCK